jgi:23S rRNA pseudouridine2605 synthase
VGERIQKYLANSGIASRRAAEGLIRTGRVRLNGSIVEELGTTIDPTRDQVEVDGSLVRPIAEHTYLALNKPTGVVSTTTDPQGRRTVIDLLDTDRRVYPVGRLDYGTEGLLLLTDDGDLTMRLCHPRHLVDKEYQVLVQGRLTQSGIQRLRDGVVLDGRVTAPAEVAMSGKERNSSWLRIVLREGRNRQVRRMVDALGGRVVRLIRTRIGPIELGTLPSGKWRKLTESEVEALRAAAR